LISTVSRKPRAADASRQPQAAQSYRTSTRTFPAPAANLRLMHSPLLTSTE